MPSVGASLLAKAICQATTMLNVPASSRAGSLPQGLMSIQTLRATENTCGSGLARECGVSFNINAEGAGLFASKPAPTGSVFTYK
jgi:hypothetical protein